MKKIIFLFLIFSGVVFAKWEVETGYATDGSPLTSFKTYDTTTITNFISETNLNFLDETNSMSETDKNLLKEAMKLFYPYIHIGVNVDGIGFSVVSIYHFEIEKEDNLVLIITDNEGNDMRCNFHEYDIEDYIIRITSERSTVLTKMLYNGKSAKLMKNFKPISTFDLRGIKQIMQKHVGSSYWYRRKLNE